MFKGSLTALITPFKNQKIDDEAFIRLINDQIAAGTDGLVVCGTTGESATMTQEEYEHVVSLCIQTVNHRIPVIVGTGANNTDKALDQTHFAWKMGADAALIVTPYYNKPTQNGLFAHYKTIQDSIDLPIILYNVPGRTGVNLTIETIGKLAELPRIVGIKDATADLLRPIEIRKVAGPSFDILSGEDATVVAFLAHGGDGCISVSANIVPKELAELHHAWQAGNFKKVAEIRDKLHDLHLAMFVETNPCPVKYAAALLGYGDGTVRLPLVEITDSSKKVVEQVLAKIRA